jgi:hypothetical protein
MKKIEKDKLDIERSNNQLQKTLKQWGTSKAQREQQSLAKFGKYNVYMLIFYHQCSLFLIFF